MIRVTLLCVSFGLFSQGVRAETLYSARGRNAVTLDCSSGANPCRARVLSSIGVGARFAFHGVNIASDAERLSTQAGWNMFAWVPRGMPNLSIGPGVRWSSAAGVSESFFAIRHNSVGELIGFADFGFAQMDLGPEVLKVTALTGFRVPETWSYQPRLEVLFSGQHALTSSQDSIFAIGVEALFPLYRGQGFDLNFTLTGRGEFGSSAISTRAGLDMSFKLPKR